jgi:Ca2+-binding RTX toxin-like protein
MGVVNTKLALLNGLKKGFDKFSKVKAIEADADHLTVFSSKKTYIEFGGTGLEYATDEKGAITGVTAGEITSVRVVLQGRQVIELSDLSVSATDVYGAILSGNAKSALDLLLAEGGATTGTKFAEKIFGGEGADKIFSLGGNDIVDGGAGDDFIDGGKGRDKLTGGEGADVFMFRKSSGSDVVVDFGNGDDVLDLSRLKGLKGFEDLMSKHVKQLGEDVHITPGNGIKIVLQDFDKESLLDSDFLF